MPVTTKPDIIETGLFTGYYRNPATIQPVGVLHLDDNHYLTITYDMLENPRKYSPFIQWFLADITDLVAMEDHYPESPYA